MDAPVGVESALEDVENGLKIPVRGPLLKAVGLGVMVALSLAVTNLHSSINIQESK